MMTLFLRSLGWSMVWGLVAFGLCRAVLLGVPAADDMGAILWPLAAAASFCAGMGHALLQRDAALPNEAAALTRLAEGIATWAFWCIVLIGTVDAALSFLRLSGGLETLLGEDMGRRLALPHDRILWVHAPLAAMAVVVARVAPPMAFLWLPVLVVGAETAIVILRFALSYEQVFMADLVRLWYGAIFLFGAAHTLARDAHVRVDILYETLPEHRRAGLDVIGTVIFGFALTVTMIWLGLAGRGAPILGPVLAFEIGQSAYGLYVKYLMALMLGVFSVTLHLQLVAFLFDRAAVMASQEGRR